MTERHSVVVAEVVDRLLDGTEARERGPLSPRARVLEHSIFLVHKIGGSKPDCAQLADLMVACYHLGKEHTLERVAIGLDTPATKTPFPSGGRPDGYDNVPIDEETICLGDEPKPPQSPQSTSRAQRLTEVDPKEWTK